MNTEVPLADVCGGITAFFQRGRYRDLFARETAGRIGKQDISLAEHSVANRIAAGEQRGAAGGTYRGRGVEIGEAQSLARHSVEVRRANGGRAVTAEITVAEIIDEDDDDVRWSFGVGGTC